MRCLAILASVLLLAAFPLSASAQAGEEGTASRPNGQEPVSEPAPEDPAVKLELDAAGVVIEPSPPRTSGGYTLEEAESRAKGAKIGVIMSVVPLVVGGILLGVSGAQVCVLGSCEDLFQGPGMAIGGAVLMGAGVVGMVGFGVMLGKRKSDLESLRKAQQRRAQWDLARSRLLF